MPVMYDDPRFPMAPFQIRRGSYAQVSNYVGAPGELFFATDTLQLFVGDGVTVGGIEISAASGGEYPVGDQGTFENPTTPNYDFGLI